uniref:Schlafen family member 13 n=1 Tax=Microcebus murinus TaxID=30608 RepID=A0A8C5Y561_MICMU|nr:schlafen family member 13-like isoform X1 [Microcebus murinus]XP_012643464.1 schlafen family member 13-like isoform X1 [Microcebus murinus]XP_012643521.1 schlafen family member 13-like isoform X1 [Microcebus murinus]XP_012643581.1 schlafen family member 13-like isoform X1 [Microcebus murinus]
METNQCYPVVERSHPDLVINIGEVSLGEGNRKKLNITQKQEKTRFTQAVCALLNSGGGVILIEMANNHERPMELGHDLEQSLRYLIESTDFHTFFEHNQQERHFSIFVKSWSSEDSSMRPGICSLSSSLYRRSGTSSLTMRSSEAFDFLKTKKKDAKNSLTNEGSPPSKIPKADCRSTSESLAAYKIFQKNRLNYGEILPFPESQSTEFKQFATKNIQKYVQEIIPEYVSAFSNSKGGYLFIGVDNESREVRGCTKENVDRNSLKNVIATAISNVPVVHFCSSKPSLQCTTKIIDVFKDDGELYGYLCVVRVEPFCCAVFSGNPKSWMVKNMRIHRLKAEEWVHMMIDPDPELLSDLAEAFESQLSLSHRPPLCRPVYSKKGLEHKVDLQRHLFPVTSDPLRYTPESLWTELSSEHEGLEELINKHMRPFSQGILIFSRSWAVDLNLHKKEGVICDALLIAQNSPPILYTILGEQEAGGQGYCTRTAFALKQKLVNTGGYTGKVCVMAKVLCLSPQCTTECLEGAVSLIDYPGSYSLGDTQQVEALLQALVIVLLGFRSFLSDQLGCEVLNLLTAQQYELFSTNLRKNRELFVHGLPGSGKTIMAMKIMEKIRNVFHCETRRILYICENQPLRNFVRKKKICEAVTRKTFMRDNFKDIDHIIIDEAQNFRMEDGDWYWKAKTITQRAKGCPGILWIFLDYFQTSHMCPSGLPSYSCQYPREQLTRVVRNADDIAKYLREIMQAIRENPPPNLPSEYLAMSHEAEWVPGVAGNITIKDLDLEEMIIYVADECHFLLRNGYSSKDIVVLFSTASEMNKYKDKFLKEMRKRKFSQIDDESTFTDANLDSVRRFSGLERNIVFGINPSTAEAAIFDNLLLCLASRANKHLYILRLSN